MTSTQVDLSRSSSPSMRILLIEDQESDAELLKRHLATSLPLYLLEWRTSLAEGLRRLDENQKFDLVLLDLNLPDSSGLSTLSGFLLKYDSLPVIVLTGVNTEDHGLEAVKMGAQDFLIKGETDPSHLRRALRFAIERKRQVSLAQSPETSEDLTLDSRTLQIDLLKQKVYFLGNEKLEAIDLTRNEFKMFLLLFRNRGAVVNRSLILSEVWAGPSNEISIRTVDRHMSSLKRKCEPYGVTIETVYGVGYRLENKDS